jgi:hypothetical protein
LHGQTIRIEGDIGDPAVGFNGIIAGTTATEWIGFRFERSFAGNLAGIDARPAARGVAADARELARLPRPAIDLAPLKRYECREAGDSVSPGVMAIGRPRHRGAGRQLLRERGDQTFEQLDEPLAGHADGVDDGQGDEPGDEAVFNGGGATLVAQKFPEHFIPHNVHEDGVARRGCCPFN